jgi:hypothetical protein
MCIWLSLIGLKLEVGTKFREAVIINDVLAIWGRLLYSYCFVPKLPLKIAIWSPASLIYSRLVPGLFIIGNGLASWADCGSNFYFHILSLCIFSLSSVSW